MIMEELDLSAALPALQKSRLQALILRTEPAHATVTFKQKFTAPLQIHMYEPPYIYLRKQEINCDLKRTVLGRRMERNGEKKINNAEM